MATRTMIALVLILALEACSNSKKEIDLQGHRGCRGLMPENTIEGFIKAIEIGVTTLEMDVVISKDNKVVVSHEPFFAHEISTTPAGEKITEQNQQRYNMYQMPYGEIKKYDVGLKPHPQFPSQQKMEAYKPLLSDVIAAAESYVESKGLKKPYYNIEIKRDPEGDSIFHPAARKFAALVIEQVKASGVTGRVCIQSFDIESLQLVKEIVPDLTTALLIANQKTFAANIEALGFNPDIYSPYFKLVDKELVAGCHEKNMQIIPWTVNDEKDMLKMLALNVDGIITDYPDRLKAVFDDKDFTVK